MEHDAGTTRELSRADAQGRGVEREGQYRRGVEGWIQYGQPGQGCRQGQRGEWLDAGLCRFIPAAAGDVDTKIRSGLIRARRNTSQTTGLHRRRRAKRWLTFWREGAGLGSTI